MHKRLTGLNDSQTVSPNHPQEQYKKVIRSITFVLVFAFLFVLCFFALQRLLTPKYMSAIPEGRLISEYYGDIKENQVVFIGDCEVYESFSPITLWEEYGITSYIRGAPQQLIWQSYYILEDTLRYETPDVVVLSVLSMKYDTPQNEAYNRINLDGMRLSSSKINAVLSSKTEGESLLSYIFPILRYHDRWRELSGDDLKYFFKADNISHNGYYMHCGIKPVDVIPVGRPLEDYSFSKICYAYLDKIVELCAKKGIRLVLVKAPSIYPYWYPQWDGQMASYAEERGLLYLNLLDLSDEIGIDYSTDTYDSGLHLNLYGAEKLSSYFGQFLRDNLSLKDMHDDERICAVWDRKCEAYYRMMNSQLQQIEEYGEVRTSVSFGEEDETMHAFVYGDTAIAPGLLMDGVLETIGKPLSIFEAQSCAFVGIDKIYYYPGFIINTYPKNGKDYILSISFSDDSVRTKEGICLGMSVSDVEEAYGAGSWNDLGNQLSYHGGGVRLSFLFENNELIDVNYYLDQFKGN